VGGERRHLSQSPLNKIIGVERRGLKPLVFQESTCMNAMLHAGPRLKLIMNNR